MYLTPLIGGWLADNYLGQRKSVIIGGLVMAAGQFTLRLARSPATCSLFYVGPRVLLGDRQRLLQAEHLDDGRRALPQGDARRDGAFTIFYMGINLGAFLAPLVCSTLGEDPAYGWRYGFMAAGIGMILSVIIQLAFAQRYLGDDRRRAGGAPRAREVRAARRSRSRTTRSIACA